MTTSTDEHHWTVEREHTIEAFGGEEPGAQLEQDCINHFVDDPERFIRTRNQIATQHAKKPFGSAWAILRSTLNRAPTQDVTASASNSRQASIDRAKVWIRNAGCHHETWQDAASELFGTNGQTAPLAYLEQLEADTRTNDGRRIYDSLLKAAIVRAKLHGREPIPDDPNAPLWTHRHDIELRTELEAEWAEHRVHAVKAQLDHEAWNAKAKADRALVLALRSHPTSEDIQFD